METQLTRTLDELRESEERARLLIEVVKDYAIFMLTPDGKIASWNQGQSKSKATAQVK
ncbi:hypothetical protein GCM10028895_47110 [Pontibacter rugosus]